MAELKLRAQPVQPPSNLGVSTINVTVGQTVNITKEMLMDSIFPYIQPQQSNEFPMGYPIGSILIVGNSLPYNRGLTATNIAGTYCYFTNNGLRLSKTSETSAIANASITNATLNGNLLKVVGVAVGTFDLKYKAKAINGTLESTEYSTVTGIIRINVVSGVNLKPTKIGNSEKDYPIYGSVTLSMVEFSKEYADPENDPIWKVKITGLPTTGQLLLDGVPVVVNQEIQASAITLGALVYVGPETDTIGSIKTVVFQVCDTGSGIYVNS